MLMRSLTGVSGFAVVFVAAVMLVVSGAAFGAAREMKDASIRDAIEDQILFDQAVPFNEVDVTVENGIATLAGDVNSVLTRERAARIAGTVKGVRSVVNKLKVDPVSERSDAQIQDDVEAALLTDPATDSYELAVDVENGRVQLSGTVDSWPEKQLALRVSKGVRGVLDVRDNITVDYKTDRPDHEIRADIMKSLQWDTLVDHGLITVRVQNGRVELSGTAGSAAEKREAVADAWVAGVRSVNADDLEVERWARDAELRKDKYVDKPDSEIQTAVTDALMRDPRVLSFNVTPTVVAGTVTLRGTVDNLKAKRAAAQDARNTVGVLRVKNRLKVRPVERLGDEEIAGNVREALKRDPFVERNEITVHAENNRVFLYGVVDSHFEKGQADDIAARVNGVSEVRNNLEVHDTTGPMVYNPYVYDWYVYGYDWYDYEPTHTYKSDREIREDIGDELWWSPFVDSDEVNVMVDDGIATLTGIVDSWSERRAATENAYEGGAIQVDNELRVTAQ